ncbi:MAG: D-aminoacylase [Rubrivivax sp.]
MHDRLIRGGTVIDGSGAPRRRADVAIDGEHIVAVGDLSGARAREVVDAEGLIVAPGFIDVHTHDDMLLLQHPARHPKLLQGVTTVVTGNCGVSVAPLTHPSPPAPLDLMGDASSRFATFADYLGALRAARPSLNALPLVGHTTLRVEAMADVSRAASDAEIARMQALLAEALQAGAAGLSTGVYYPPARAATTQELIEVGRPLAGSGLVTMHIRDESDAIDDALREALAVGRALDVDLVLSHHKLMGVANHGRSRETLALLEQATQAQRVCIDCYPYDASSTMLLPERVGVSRDVQITWSKTEPAAAGRSLRQMAAERGLAPEALAAQLQPAGAIYFAMSEDDVERILAHPLTMVGSDGLPHDLHPHPRLWGSFPRVLGRYARERGLFSLEQAVHKMTGLTARRLRLHGRGLVAPGAYADLVLFDAAQVADRADFGAPTQAPAGIRAVWVNGAPALVDGECVPCHAGRLLHRGPVPE